MMPAQGSTISDTTHFTGGQVRSPTCLTCPAHLMADLSPDCFCHAPKASMVSCVDPDPAGGVLHSCNLDFRACYSRHCVVVLIQGLDA